MASPGVMNRTSAAEMSIHAVSPLSMCIASPSVAGHERAAANAALGRTLSADCCEGVSEECRGEETCNIRERMPQPATPTGPAAFHPRGPALAPRGYTGGSARIVPPYLTTHREGNTRFAPRAHLHTRCPRAQPQGLRPRY